MLVEVRKGTENKEKGRKRIWKRQCRAFLVLQAVVVRLVLTVPAHLSHCERLELVPDVAEHGE